MHASTVAHLSFLVLAACSDASVTKTNALPEAQITSPADGTGVREGQALTLRGQASDPNHATGELLARWFTGSDEACASAAPAPDGSSTCGIVVPEGEALVVRFEVLDPDGAVGVASVTLPIAPDADPVVSITSPDGTGPYYSDQLVALRASVEDDVDAPGDLGLRWVSSLDGEVAAPSTVTASGQVEAFARFSEGQHALQLLVTDSAGNEVVDSVLFEVGPPNTAPACEISAPASGSSVEQGSRVELLGLATDVDVPSSRLSVAWESDKDGRLGTSAPDSDGSVGYTTTGLSADTHRLTMRVTDEVGAECATSITLTVGTPPTLEVLSPADGTVVNEGEDLVFQATVSDAEDVASALTVTWESDRDGALASGSPDSTGEAGFLASDLAWGDHALTVTARDSSGLFAVERLSFTVNGLPTAPGVSITPAAPYGDDDLVVAIDVPSVDPEGDRLTYSYVWYQNGVLSGASTGATLPGSATTRGDRWTVEVWASDGLGESPVGSAGVTIANTAPVLAGVSITPAAPTRSSTLTCTPAGASDADGDSVSYGYAWTLDGVAAGSASTLSGPFASGSVAVCAVTPTDGTTAGSPVSASVTITNTAPLIDSVTLTPGTVYTNDTVTASVVSSDADGDTVSLVYAWYVNGVRVAETGGSLSGAVYFDRDDTVSVQVTPSDADGAGAAVTSSTLTVSNSAPSAPTVAITPVAPVEGDSLACAVTGASTDADGDSLTYSFAWDVDGVAYSGASGSASTSTAPGSAVDGGETWTCEAIALDGAVASRVASATVTVARVGSSASAAGVSCADILDRGGSTGDGTYWVNPDGSGAYLVYCDMTTDGGGWTLMAKFSQHATISGLPAATFSAYFHTNLWIDGYADAVPTSPSPAYDGYHVESVDWSDFLAVGASYELRQRFFKGAGTSAMDVSYGFSYNGYTDQNAASGTDRAWELSSRRVHEDTSGIAWHTPSETVRFWLPFKAGVSGAVYAACSSYSYSTTGTSCDRMLDASTRHYGGAGIMGASADANDPAGSWAPIAYNQVAVSDLVIVHQARETGYGYTGAPMALLYFVR